MRSKADKQIRDRIQERKGVIARRIINEPVHVELIHFEQTC